MCQAQVDTVLVDKRWEVVSSSLPRQMVHIEGRDVVPVGTES